MDASVLGASPFVISSRAFPGPHSESGRRSRPLFFPPDTNTEGEKKGIMMKKVVYGVAIVSIAFCVGGLTGCQALEAAKNNVVTGIAASGLKSDIDARCKQYEESNDGAGMKTYLDGLLKAEPKPEGWNDSVVELVNSWLAKANSMIRRSQVQSTYDKYIANGEVDKAKEYLTKILAAKGKVANWDELVEKLAQELLAKVNGELLKFRCAKIWEEVKAALDKRDFATARKLTATAKPYADEAIRNDIQAYRIGILNEIINPYQCDWTIYQMKSKVAMLKESGKENEVGVYLKSVELVKDDIPSIEEKVRGIKPGLENLYWLDDRIQIYLSQNIAEIQRILDERSVGGEHRDYKEVYDLVDAAVAEMKLYNPTRTKREVEWEERMKSVRRVMTTTEANAAISAAKAELSK